MHVYFVGDSTMQHNDAVTYPQMGWAQVMPAYFIEGITLHNHAKNGRSSKSFLEEGLFEPVKALMQPNDVLFIQFGHNDQKDDHRKTEPFSTYQTYLKYMALSAKEKGVYPIFLTSVTRRDFTKSGLNPNTHGLYPRAMKELANELDVPCIDVFEASFQEVSSLGIEESMKLYMHIRPNSFAYYPNGLHDNTHLQEAGCHMVARIVSKGLIELGKPYCDWVKKKEDL